MSLTDLVSRARTGTASRLQIVLGVIFCVVAVVGSTLFGWDFSGTPEPLPAALGIVAFVIAVGAVVFLRED